MPEVERMCDDALIMKAGRIVDRGAPADLVARHGRATLEDVFLHFTGRTIREEDASGKDRMRMARRLWRR